MATSNPPAHDAHESSESGVGLAHLTVVPTNLEEAEAGNDERER